MWTKFEILTTFRSQKFLDFCKTLIETYILVLIKLQCLRSHKDSFLNALNVFRVTSEERQNYVKLVNFSPLSAGFSHAGCIVDNFVYLWGRNDVNCAMNRNVLQSGEFIVKTKNLRYKKNNFPKTVLTPRLEGALERALPGAPFAPPPRANLPGAPNFTVAP